MESNQSIDDFRHKHSLEEKKEQRKKDERSLSCFTEATPIRSPHRRRQDLVSSTGAAERKSSKKNAVPRRRSLRERFFFCLPFPHRARPRFFPLPVVKSIKENMGLWLSRLSSLFGGDQEARILVLGLDNAGELF